MKPELLILLALAHAAWVIVGIIVMSALDDDEGRLLDWADQNPLGGIVAFVALWPLAVLLVVCLRRHAQSG